MKYYTVFPVLTLAVCTIAAEPISIPLTRMNSPLKHIIANAHKPEYKPIIKHLEMLRGAKNTVPLFKFLDYEFYGDVLLGHPGQTMRVVFDTSWADLWVPSILCPSINPACVFKNKYDSSHSSTYMSTGKKYKLSLGKYALTGKISMELLHVAQMNITNQTFGEVDDIPWKEFMFTKADGIFGLAFDNLATDGITPFFYNLIKQNLISKHIFSIYMNRDLGTKKGGAILLGDIDPKHYSGNISYVRVDPKEGFWKIPVDNITIAQPKGDILFCNEGCTSVLDSSTNEIRGPIEDIDKINGLIKARRFMFGRSTIDCGTANTLPHITFMIAGKPYVLKGKDFTQKMNYGPATICLSSFTRYESGKPNEWTFGGAFLAKFYTVFDMEATRVGFAKANL